MNIQFTSPRDPDFHYITVTTEAFVTLTTFHPNVHRPRSLTSSAFTVPVCYLIYLQIRNSCQGPFFILDLLWQMGRPWLNGREIDYTSEVFKGLYINLRHNYQGSALRLCTADRESQRALFITLADILFGHLVKHTPHLMIRLELNKIKMSSIMSY